jgi:hypothetical protein
MGRGVVSHEVYADTREVREQAHAMRPQGLRFRDGQQLARMGRDREVKSVECGESHRPSTNL